MNIYEAMTTAAMAAIKMRPRWLIGKVGSRLRFGSLRSGSTGRMLDDDVISLPIPSPCQPKLSKSNACVQV